MFDLTNFSGGVVSGIILVLTSTILFGEPVNQKILNECVKKHWVAECQVVAVPKPKPVQ